VTVRIITGDCRERLRELDDESVHYVVTSPPYFGLRDYGVGGQIGLEATPDAFVAELVEVFREVRRVLRKDGTVWLNLGDSYSSGGRGSYDVDPKAADVERPLRKRGGPPSGKSTLKGNGHRGGGPKLKELTPVKAGSVGRAWVAPPAGFKPKDLLGMPWRVAFALQADGWYLRQDIIWHKPNPMPESVRDRCTKAHEYLFLLTKSERYHFDADAIAEARAQDEDANGFRGGCYVGGETDNGSMGKRRVPGNKTHKGQSAYQDGDARHRTKAGLVAYAERERSLRNSFARDTKDSGGVTGEKPQFRPDREPVAYEGRRNKRSVWTVASEPFKEAHFATYPQKLIEPCILAGCPRGGVVLDPFGGAGTTGLVASRFDRSAILIELNPEYAAMADRRLRAALAQVEGERKADPSDLPLFSGEAA